MAEDRPQGAKGLASSPRRTVLAAATVGALAPVISGCSGTPRGEGGSRDAPLSFEEGRRRLIEPVSTTEAHWHGVAETLGRTGQLVDNQKYQVAFRRGDLNVISYGVTVKPELTVGSYATFIRYADQHTTMMGDLAV